MAAKKGLPAQGSDAILRAMSEANAAMLRNGSKKASTKASSKSSKTKKK